MHADYKPPPLLVKRIRLRETSYRVCDSRICVSLRGVGSQTEQRPQRKLLGRTSAEAHIYKFWSEPLN
jgi:hypothetical protein